MDFRKFAIVTLILVSCFPSLHRAGSGGIAIKAGGNFTKTGVITGDTKVQPGITLGLTYEKKPVQWFGFETGGLYHWKRSKTTDLVVDSTLFSGFKSGFQYVEIPLTFKVYPINRFNVHAGPYLSYLIAAKGEGVDRFGANNIWNLISDPEFRDENGEAFMNRLDFGLHFGLEFASLSGFGLGARYSHGFGDITNKDFEWSGSLISPKSERVQSSSAIVYIFYAL